ncbi:MAG: ABC transporter permease [Dehalococcoidia bacterium]
MKIKSVFMMAIFSVTANKLRTFLTLLGIVIGVAAVISLMSIGRGTQQAITAQIEALGTDLLFVSPKSDGNLTLADANLIASDPRTNFLVAPQITAPASITFRGEETSAVVNGVTGVYASVRNLEIDSGNFLSPSHVKNRNEVVVLGYEVAKDIFDERLPINEYVSINGRRFKVIGVLEEKGGGARFGSEDGQIFVPLTTAYYRLTSERTTQGEISISTINVQSISNGDLVDKTVEDPKEQISDILRFSHRTTEDDFSVTNLQDVINTLNEATAALVVLLGSIAGISLFVGGIGIMNIMLVSVTERTREIGIRKALGAKKRDILGQFITEAVLISVSGGVIGASLGALISYSINRLRLFGPDFETVITADIAILALTVAGVIGLFFGIYPAARAAKLNPIDALRYE